MDFYRQKMFRRIFILFFLLALLPHFSYGLEPEQILIIANRDKPESSTIANYYHIRRDVPTENILELPLGTSMAEQISRSDYENKIATPIRQWLRKAGHEDIRCLLTIYGVPLKIANSPKPKDSEKNIAKLKPLMDKKLSRLRQQLWVVENIGQNPALATEFNNEESYKSIAIRTGVVLKKASELISKIQNISERDNTAKKFIKLLAEISGKYSAIKIAEKNENLNYQMGIIKTKIFKRHISLIEKCNKNVWSIEEKFKYDYYNAIESAFGLNGLLRLLNDDINRAENKETFASVDSELSCVLKGKYDLYRWKANELKGQPLWAKTDTLMVSRIDGPGMSLCLDIINKSINAQKSGITGKAYIDLRGVNGKGPFRMGERGYYDDSLKKLGVMLEKRTNLDVVVERTSKLFSPDSCPQTALYCGWYSVKKYVDAFDFVDGAIGFHIASFEAVDLRNPKSSNWCPAMLVDGITATFGAVNEPYLHSFPEPELFFAELLNGRTIVEAFYLTKPLNSWQLVLIADPLYKLNLIQNTNN